MWFKKNRNKDEENVLYVSVDGRSIGVGFYTGNVCHYSERRIQVAGETTRPIEILFKDILYAFKHVNTRTIDRIEVILENPWVKEISYSIKDKRLRPFVVTDKTINELIKKDSSKNKQDIADAVDLGYFLESVKLNGYNYKDYLNKITDEIELHVTRFYGDKATIDIVDSGIKSFWNKTKISFTTGNEFLFKIASQNNLTNEMYVSLGSTHFSMRIYSQGIVNKSSSVAFGFQNIIQKLGEIWQTNSTETKHWLDMLVNGELSDEESTRVSADIKNAIIPMCDLLIESSKSGLSLELERPIVVTGIDRSWNELFVYMYKNKFFGEIFPHAEGSKIVILNTKENKTKSDILIALYVEEITKDYAKKSN